MASEAGNHATTRLILCASYPPLTLALYTGPISNLVGFALKISFLKSSAELKEL